MGAENYVGYQQAIHDPETVHGMVEDYRAGLATDHQHDLADREAGRRIQCPTLVLWSEQDDLPELYGDVLEVWKPWTTTLSSHRIASSHHMAEEAPEQLAPVLIAFFP